MESSLVSSDDKSCVLKELLVEEDLELLLEEDGEEEEGELS